jgi:HAD superfamily hydrolase (TIGR01509 family)
MNSLPVNRSSEKSRAVIFDVDGTLVDSVDLHARAWQEALADYGKQVSFGDVRKQIGKGCDQLLPVFLSSTELERFGQPLEKYRDHIFRERYLARVRPLPKVRELFDRIRSDGILIGLASSADRDDLKYFKRLTRIEDLLDQETSSEDVRRSKPHPDVFAVALDALGHPDPECVLVVGDTPYDAEAAAKIGLRTIGLLSGGFPAHELEAAGCVALYRDPEDLYRCYPESPLAMLAVPKHRLQEPTDLLSISVDARRGAEPLER